MAFDDGMLIEIFSWLSGKSLCKFSLVSRSIDKLLSDDFFIRKQSRNLQFQGDSDFFIQSYGYDEKLQLHGIYSQVNQSSLFTRKAVKILSGFGQILASFNGLICSLKDEEGPLYLFNPTTRSYMQVPFPDGGWFSIVFAGEERGSVNDYTLLSVVTPSEWGAESRLMVFSPSEKIWKDFVEVDFGGRNMVFDHTVQLKGVLYFVSNSGLFYKRESQFFWPYIVAYDIKDQTSTFLKIPKNARKGSLHSNLAIFKWGRPRSEGSTICLVRSWRSMFTIWALCTRVDSSTTSNWKRVFHMRIKAMGLSDFDRTAITGYSIMNGATLLLATDQKLYSYDLLDQDRENAKFRELCEHDFGGAKVHFHSFCSTLRRCGPDHAVRSFDA